MSRTKIRVHAFALTGTIFLMTCCFQPKVVDDGVRSALDVIADVTGSTSQLAREACDAREAMAVADAKSGTTTSAAAEATITESRKRCDEVREKIDLIRATHSRAVELYEGGKLDEARRTIEEARSLFRSLNKDQVSP